MSYGEKTDFPHALPFILGFFPTTHVCEEHCDWLNSAEVTPSSHFRLFKCRKVTVGNIPPGLDHREGKYLSPSSSCLARRPHPTSVFRHPRPSLGIDTPLGWHWHLGHCPAGGRSAWHPRECGRLGHCPALAHPRPDFSALSSWFSSQPLYLRAPVSFVVLLSVQLKPAY